jgi:hypothetical protein
VEMGFFFRIESVFSGNLWMKESNKQETQRLLVHTLPRPYQKGVLYLQSLMQ